MMTVLLVIGLTLLGFAVRFGIPLFAALGRKMGTVWMAGAISATLMLIAGICYAIPFSMRSPVPKEGCCIICPP